MTCRIASVLLALALLAGCGVAPWVAHGVAGGKGKKKVEVKAQYTKLADKKTAILVAADEYILYRHRHSTLAVARAVGTRLAEHVPGIEIVPPSDVIAFQDKNPYWTTVPYGELVGKLGVDRLVVIDLIEYRTHEPGNAYVKQGMIAAEVNVVEAESEDPDNPAFVTTVRAQYPEEGELGMVNSDDETIEVGVLVLFSRDAAGLFYDHEVMK